MSGVKRVLWAHTSVDHGRIWWRLSIVANTLRSCPHSWLITRFVTKLIRWVPLVEQELLTLPGAPEFTPGLYWGSCYSIFSFMCVFCRSLFVLLCFFFWPLCCLSFFDIRILITSMVSSNSSYPNNASFVL